MKILTLLALVLAQATHPDSAAAPIRQPAPGRLAELRDQVLVRTGKTLPRDLHLFPLAPGAGRAFVQTVHEAGASALKLHFKLLARSADPWRVVVSNRSGQWQHLGGPSSARGEEEEFWSDQLSSSDLMVEVYTTKPGSSLKLVIDKVAALIVPPRPQSITGRNDLASIVGQDPWIVALGRSVALIRFSADNGIDYVCTGFLVAKDLVLTNQHCISSATEARSAEVVFDFDSAAAPVTSFRAAALERTDYDLDYSLLRLEQAVQRPALHLSRSAGVEGENLLMIEHPGGKPKQVSISGCTLRQASVAGRSQWSDCPVPGAAALPTDFAHECDTQPGSSGSPVFEWVSREVIGLHHLGFCPGGPLVNRAVGIRFILDDLRARRPDLLAELSATEAAAAPAAP